MAKKKDGDPSVARLIIAFSRWFDSVVPNSVQNALSLAMIFMLISYGATTGVAMLSPSDRYVQIEEVRVTDTNPNATSHDVYVKWDAADNYPARVTTRLYYMSGNGSTSEVGKWQFDTALKGGTHSANITYDLPAELRGGSYYYTIRVDYRAEYGVHKQFSFETPTFYIGNQSSNETQTETFSTSRAHSETLIVNNVAFDPGPLLLTWHAGSDARADSRDGMALSNDTLIQKGNHTSEAKNATAGYSDGENDAAAGNC